MERRCAKFCTLSLAFQVLVFQGGGGLTFDAATCTFRTPRMYGNHQMGFSAVLLFAATSALSGMMAGDGVLLHQPGGFPNTGNALELQQGVMPTGEQAAVFSSVESGILAGNAGSMSPFFGTRVFVQLRGAEGGYFSAAQSYYILESFFMGRRTVSARFTTYGKSDTSPYATGSASFIMKGKREDAQMYVALSPVGKRWVISHLSIY
jgi:hypothetical protein